MKFVNVKDASILIPEDKRIAQVSVRFSFEDAEKIVNRPGSELSARLYAKHKNKSGFIGPKEAKEMLDEFLKLAPAAVDEEKKSPGKHPNIGRLFRIIEKNEQVQISVEYHPSPKILGVKKSEVLLKVSEQFGTPVQVYFEEDIVNTAKELKTEFSKLKNFKNFFAVKAAPNPFLIKILHNQGMGTDCSSDTELQLSKLLGIKGKEIMFTSNDTPNEEFVMAKKLGAIINLDDIKHIAILKEVAGIPDTICFRYNPGKLKRGNIIVGNPFDAKYGLSQDQLIEAYKIAKREGVKHFGIHTMVASNERDPEYFIDTARLLFETVKLIKDKTGIDIEFVNLGGGIGIPYTSEQKKVDLAKVFAGIKEQHEKIILKNNLLPPDIVMECGRMVTGPNGFLITKVRHVTEKYKDYVGVDACMANLMRHALYGSYHEITPLGKEHLPHDTSYDVTGSLCENNDRLATNRRLPKLERGDILVIHDTGAHGHAMGFNYNGKKRAREVLIRTDGSFFEIRRPEEFKDLTATIPLKKLKDFKV